MNSGALFIRMPTCTDSVQELEIHSLEEAWPADLSAQDVKLLEVAWQLIADHSLQIESSRHGTWEESVVPALESAKQQLSILSPERNLAAYWLTEAAFRQYARRSGISKVHRWKDILNV